MTAAFIALDWGTTSFRAYLVDHDAHVLESRSGADGILSVKDGGFAVVLERHIGDWDKALPVLAAGMITSKQGWIEVPYCACPAGLIEIAAALRRHRTQSGRDIAFVPGLSVRAAHDAPDVMRGEETQILGAATDGVFVLPGTHSKWVHVRDGRIANFTTFMTGEVFAALRQHTILGRLMTAEEHDRDSFERGVRLGLARPDLLLHSLFSVRTLGLFDEIGGAHLASYLSGLLLGCEIAAARTEPSGDGPLTILGSEALTARYGEALALAGLEAKSGPPDITVNGLARIGKAAGIIA